MKSGFADAKLYKVGELVARRYLFVVANVLLLQSLVMAQGNVQGRVVDGETGEPLAGANVVIVGTKLGAATDEDGKYFISEVPEGVDAVSAEYIGYKSATVSEVRIESSIRTVVDFKLQPVPVKPGAVEVIAGRESS